MSKKSSISKKKTKFLLSTLAKIRPSTRSPDHRLNLSDLERNGY